MCQRDTLDSGALNVSVYAGGPGQERNADRFRVGQSPGYSRSAIRWGRGLRYPPLLQGLRPGAWVCVVTWDRISIAQDFFVSAADPGGIQPRTPQHFSIALVQRSSCAASTSQEELSTVCD